MPSFGNLPIMPRESTTSASTKIPSAAPYPYAVPPAVRSAAIWNSTDDENLLQARASGLNWGPIARRYFPNKTPNACRKRHERLVERRQVEDWDVDKLELLAQEYMTVRKEMWEMLGNRLGERWSVVEAKCMEKGLKNLQAASRSSQRRQTSVSMTGSIDDHGTATDRHSDSGIGLGSDGEMEVDNVAGRASRRTPSSWHSHPSILPPTYSEHTRSQSLPQSLPLYQPPPAVHTEQHRDFDAPTTSSPTRLTFAGPRAAFSRFSPEIQGGRGNISIQSMLAPAEPQRV